MTVRVAHRPGSPALPTLRRVSMTSRRAGSSVIAAAAAGASLSAVAVVQRANAWDLGPAPQICVDAAVGTGFPLVAVLVLLREPPSVEHLDTSGARRALASAKESPAVVREGLGMLRDNVVLRGIVTVELFWSVAMIVFETFQPIRLAELVGGEERAGALMGPVTAAGWAVFAVGAALAGWASRRMGVARTAILARILNGIPPAVVGGSAVVVFAIIAVLGIQMLARVDFNQTGNLITATVGLAAGLLPVLLPGMYAHLPANAASLLGSGVAMAAFVSVLLNLLFHHTGRRDRHPKSRTPIEDPSRLEQRPGDYRI